MNIDTQCVLILIVGLAVWRKSSYRPVNAYATTPNVIRQYFWQWLFNGFDRKSFVLSARTGEPIYREHRSRNVKLLLPIPFAYTVHTSVRPFSKQLYPYDLNQTNRPDRRKNELDSCNRRAIFHKGSL